MWAGWTWAVIRRIPEARSHAHMAALASDAMPRRCHGVPMTQATSASVPTTVACTKPTGWSTRRMIQLCQTAEPSAGPATWDR